MSNAGVLHVAVGSKNPVKINSAVVGISKALLNEVQVEPVGYDVPSNVPDQPWGDEETKTGAINRAKAAYEAAKEDQKVVKYSLGLEGGIAKINEDGVDALECFAWIAIFDGEKLGLARTASFSLPPAICRLVEQGMELGHADDAVFGSVNSKQAGGAVGHLTRGAIDRQAYYEQAVVMAMIPFLWPDLYC